MQKHRKTVTMKPLGKHTIVEFYDCDTDRLSDAALLERALCMAAKNAGVTVIKSTFHKFSPHGVTGIVIIAESHLSIHTWPEYGYAAVDIFTCGSVANNYKAIECLKEMLRATRHSAIELERGILPGTTNFEQTSGIKIKNINDGQKATTQTQTLKDM